MISNDHLVHWPITKPLNHTSVLIIIIFNRIHTYMYHRYIYVMFIFYFVYQVYILLEKTDVKDVRLL